MKYITKRKKLDNRTIFAKKWHDWFNRYTLASGMWGLLIGSLLGMYFSLNTQNTSLEAVKPLVTNEVVKVTAMGTPCDYDAITFVRCRGQELGYKDTDISVFVRIARVESNFNQYAKNRNSTAKGIYQFIDSTWRHYCLKDGNVYDFKANIDCFYRVLEIDGFPKGLSHWSSSKNKWNK